MGTQTQDPNRQRQGGTDKQAPSNDPKAPHDPKLDPERDQRNGSERRTDQQQQREQSGSRKRSSAGDADSDEDDEDNDSIEQPGQGGAIDDGEKDRGGNR